MERGERERLRGIDCEGERYAVIDPVDNIKICLSWSIMEVELLGKGLRECFHGQLWK